MTKLDLSNYNAVAEQLKIRSAGIQAHEINLLAEVAAQDGGHAYGRHGFQIGWQAQLIRCVTRVAPDQKFDPTGTGGTIQAWNALSSKARMLDDHGAAIATELSGPFMPGETDYKTVAGIMAGGFLGPEHQEDVRKIALAFAGTVSGPDCANIEYQFMNAPVVELKIPFTSFCYGIEGRFFGMGYKRKPGFVTLTHEFVIFCIWAFEQRFPLTTLELFMPGSVVRLPYMVGPKNPVSLAFPQIGDLFDFLQVETFEQKSVRVVMRRTYAHSTNSFGSWRIVTMFPDDTITSNGFHPGNPYFSTETKSEITKMTQMKESKSSNIKKFGHLTTKPSQYTWTGKTFNLEKTTFKIHPTPSWT
jgi:hypothetical protein